MPPSPRLSERWFPEAAQGVNRITQQRSPGSTEPFLCEEEELDPASGHSLALQMDAVGQKYGYSSKDLGPGSSLPEGAAGSRVV